MVRIIIAFLFIALITGCTKSELEVIPGNQAPPDKTISSVTIENYITRTYILALGREPDNSEFTMSKSLLSGTNLDSASRRIFLNDVFSSASFRPHVYEELKINLLNNADTADYTMWINLFQLLSTDSTYIQIWSTLQFEINRLIPLRNAFNEYVNGTIEIDEVQRRMCDNYLYDLINMGSANFVISTFQNLINRNPTDAEQSSGISMIEGNNAILFLQAGSSKTDYLNIFTQSSNYFEGQVVFMYLKYLRRLPTTLEMVNGTQRYETTGDYSAVQSDILSTDEFIGL